jgi:tetratricopeptide (TPR) repeat protein
VNILKAFRKGGDESDPQYWMSKGEELGGAGDFEAALTCYERAIALSPQDPGPWIVKADAQSELGREEECFASYARAIELAPEHPVAWFAQGHTLMSLGRASEAQQCLQEAERLGMSEARELLDTLQKAVAELSPEQLQAQALMDRATHFVECQRLDQALACFDRVSALTPESEEAWFSKASVLGLLNRDEEALACAERVLAINPQSDVGWATKAATLGEMGRNEESVAAYKRAVEINPEYAEAWYGQGVALEQLGRTPEALECFEQAKRLGLKEAKEAITRCRKKK